MAGRQGGKVLQASEELIWGLHPVQEALEQQPRLIAELFVNKGREGAKSQHLVDLARQQGVNIRFVSGLQIRGAGRIQHQGVAARLNRTETLSEHELLAKLEDLTTPAFVLALDTIQDPHNLGAILRSAAAAGVDGVILPRDRTAPLGGTAAKVAAGAMAHLDICRVTNLASFLKELKALGIWVYGTIKEAPQTIYHSDLVGPCCLVIGNEEKGIRPLVLKQCDQGLTIPMPGKLDSLNASVAAGISLFEVVRQRQDISVK